MTVAADGVTDASFDLFPPDQAIPTEGMRQGSLATAYNISKGATVHLRHKFTRGEIFTFAGEGNWLSTAGSQGTARYTVNVQ